MRNRRQRMRNTCQRSVSVLNERLTRSDHSREQSLYLKVRGKYSVRCTRNDEVGKTIVASGELSNVVISWARGSSVRAMPDSVYSTPTASAPLNVGAVTQAVENAGPTLLVPITEGDNFVDVTGSAPLAGEWYYLIDFNRLERQANGSTYRPIGGELVQVNTVEQIDASTWNVIFYQNVGRDYPAGSRLSNSPNGKVLQNIGIRGLRVTGIRDRANDKGTLAALNIRFVAGLSMQNCRVGTSWSTGTAIHYCRDVEIIDHSATGVGKSGSTGTGYSLQIKQCAEVKANQISASDARYACQLEAGCTGFTVTGVVGGDPIGAAVFDIHGGDSYNGTVTQVHCTPDQAVQLGNSSWRLGATSVTFENCTFGKLAVQGSVTNCTVMNSRMNNVQIFSYKDTSPFQAYIPDNLQFENCSIVCETSDTAISLQTGAGSSSLYYYNSITFDNCTIQAHTGQFVLEMPVVADVSTVSFDGCTVTAGSTADLMKIGGLDSFVNASSTTFILETTKKIAIAGSPAGTFYNMTNGGTTNNTRDPNPSAPPPTRSLVSGDVTCTWSAN